MSRKSWMLLAFVVIIVLIAVVMNLQPESTDNPPAETQTEAN